LKEIIDIDAKFDQGSNIMSSGIKEKQVVVTKSPNFDRLWEYAKKFPEFSTMGKQNWKEFCNQSCYYTDFQNIKDKLLENSKQTKNENKEIPVFIKFTEEDIQSLESYNPKNLNDVMIIDLSNLMYAI
jgi:hypothetical protein